MPIRGYRPWRLPWQSCAGLSVSSSTLQLTIAGLSDKKIPAHEDHVKTTWISRILPLEMFAEICRKVYFAVEDYDDVDFILANGYLYYVFSEHVIVSGLDENREYYTLCRENFQNAFSQLPLLLSPSMKVVAALTLGVRVPVKTWRMALTH